MFKSFKIDMYIYFMRVSSDLELSIIVTKVLIMFTSLQCYQMLPTKHVNLKQKLSFETLEVYYDSSHMVVFLMIILVFLYYPFTYYLEPCPFPRCMLSEVL